MNGVRVKLCGMRTANDVDAAVAAGADAVGVVVLSPRSTRNLDPATAGRLVRKAAPDVSTVMVTASTDAASLLDTARAVGPDAVQVPATTGPKALEALAAEGLDVWLATRPVPADEAMALFDHADAIVLDAVVDGYGGTGDRLDEASAATVVRAVAPRPVVLAGGLTPANVSDAIAAVRPWAVDVSSGIETDGIKDPDLMQAFVNAVRGAGSP